MKKIIIDPYYIMSVDPHFSHGRRDGCTDEETIDNAGYTYSFMENFYDKHIPYVIEIEELSEEDGGGWSAKVPKLQGCMSDGETPYEAFINVLDAMDGWIETAKELGRDIPK